MSRQYEYYLPKVLKQLERQIRLQPMNLGGVSTSGGGTGGPPGGFIGVLPQTRVAYDTSELEINTTASGATLLDNLNHIRYRIANLEVNPTGISIENNDVLVASGVTIVNFEGTVDVVDNGGNQVTVTISGGTGSGNPIDVYWEDTLIESEVSKVTLSGYVEVTNPSFGEALINIVVDGSPLEIYNDTYANINALTGYPAGTLAFSPDWGMWGFYDGYDWRWFGSNYVEGIDGYPTMGFWDINGFYFPEANVSQPWSNGATISYDGVFSLPITVKESDDIPEINNVTTITFSGASVADLGNGEVLVTVYGSGGSSGGHIIEDETTPLAQRTKLSFQGTNVEVTDDALNDRTVVTVSGIGGITDHGALTGLADDDHIQYHNDTRGDARYAPIANGVTNGDSHDHVGGDGAQIDHTGLSNLNSTTYTHLTSANHTDLTDSGATTLHKHDHGGQDGLTDNDHPQ
jgi:hypothetical protein